MRLVRRVPDLPGRQGPMTRWSPRCTRAFEGTRKRGDHNRLRSSFFGISIGIASRAKRWRFTSRVYPSACLRACQPKIDIGRCGIAPLFAAIVAPAFLSPYAEQWPSLACRHQSLNLLPKADTAELLASRAKDRGPSPQSCPTRPLCRPPRILNRGNQPRSTARPGSAERRRPPRRQRGCRSG